MQLDVFVVVSWPFNTDVCSCVNTLAHPYLLASVNIVYGLEVLGYFKIGAKTSVSFSIWNDNSHCSHQTNTASCDVSFDSGHAISENLGTNFL